MTDTAIIVGAGQAGAHAAIAMREAGYAGPILLIGAEVERPHERPPLSKDMLTADAEPPLLYFHTEQLYADNGITLMLNTNVTGLDPAAHEIRLADGRVLPYAHLVLAPGGRARRLQISGAERAMTMRTVDDARALRQRLVPGAQVVCIGAGVIGLEVASSARARGCAVTVIEPAPSLMSRSLAPALSGFLADLHRGAGVDLRLGASVAAITDRHVIGADGSAIAADVVIAGIGMERNTTLAEVADLALDDGIVVDEFGRTSAPDVYAAGDVAAFWVPRLQRYMRLETWRHAQDHGAAVGRAVAGSLQAYDEIPWFWTDQHGVNVQVAGLCIGAASAVIRGDGGSASFAAWYLDADGAVIGVAGVNAPREVRAGRGLIRDGRPVDVAKLSDSTLPAQRLAGIVLT